jgi:hypothetical protein
MGVKAIVLLFLACICLSGAPPHQVMIIVPGASVGPYGLGVTYADLKQALGRGKAEKQMLTAPRCGMHHYWTALSYSSEGLIFELPGRKLSSDSKVSHIKVVRPNDVVVSNVGLWSSRADVRAVFGPTDTSDGASWLYYGKRGIEFEFSTVYPDSMVSVRIFEPRPDSRY